MDAPGFRDEPDCFIADEYTTNEVGWTEGFVTLTTSTTDHNQVDIQWVWSAPDP